MEIQELTLIVSVVGVICTVSIAYYSKVYIHRKKEKEKKREEVYNPLLSEINNLIEKVRNKVEFVPSFWKTLEGKVSSDLFEKIKNVFQDGATNYFELLKHNQEFIRFKGYFYLDFHLPELQKEYHSLGVGSLEFELYGSIVTPILNGESVNTEWIKNNKRDFYKHLLQCPSYEKLEELLKWLNEKNLCVQSLRKAERELIQSAEKLRDALKKL